MSHLENWKERDVPPYQLGDSLVGCLTKSRCQEEGYKFCLTMF